jgi:6-phosphogluconolactonase
MRVITLVTIAMALMSTPVSAATVVYIGNTDSNEIYVMRLERESGDLTLVEKISIPGVTKPSNSTPMAVSPDRRFLYAATRGEPKIAAAFAIDQAAGTLKHVASGPLADSMAYIATDRTGRYLLSASYPGHKVTVNPIAPPGTVQPPQQVLENHPNAHSILPDASNRHVVFATLGNDLVNVFAFDAAKGMLTPSAEPAARLREKAGPRHFRFHPNGTLLYVLGELDAAVYVFDYDAGTGRLKVKQNVSALPPDFQGKPSAADMHITPNGKFLYASERTSSTLAAFRIDPGTGTLTALGSVPTEKQPRGFAIDSTGRYLLAVGQLSHAMSTYRIDGESGKLVKLKEYPMGKNPNWIEIVDLP